MNQQNEELHQRTIEVLKKCVPFLTDEELSLLLHIAGLTEKDIA